MKLKLFFLLSIFSFMKLSAQFQFTGKVNNSLNNGTAYLSLIDDCNKKTLFFTENIIQESKIEADGSFLFKGNVLDKKNRIYKIHIDNCNDNISDYKHLLNHCENSKEVLFIANNSDIIDFPLNDLSQVFCDINPSNLANSAIVKIEELQENILGDLQNAKSDRQRKNIYFKHFKELQKFSKQFNEPLAEVYAYHLYANENFLSRNFYLKNLKKSDYYNDLLNRLETNYPNTNYTKIYKNTLIKDKYPLLKSKNSIYKTLVLLLGLLFLVSLFYNFKQFKTNKKATIADAVLDYKEILTSQEQKVFVLMLGNTNKEIADKLFISLSTVKTHINNIYSKLSIRSRKEIKVFFN